MGRPREFKLTDEQIRGLIQAEEVVDDVNPRQPGANTRMRLVSVRLYGTGYSEADVERVSRCSRRSVVRWSQKYEAHGVAGLLDKRAGGNGPAAGHLYSLLSVEELERLELTLHRYTPEQKFGTAVSGGRQYWRVIDVRRLVKQDYGVEYRSSSSYHNVLERCGMSYQQTERYYKSRRESQLIDFEETLEKQLVDIAQSAPQTVILAEDEASLYLQATQNREWAPQGQTPKVALRGRAARFRGWAIVRVAAGRDNTHIYGRAARSRGWALNLRTGQQTAIESPVMNAVATLLFLQMLLTVYPDLPILLLWDRGPTPAAGCPWHKGQKIRDFLAAHPRLQVLFFPPGCPDLNPQEHVWKDARQAVSHNHNFVTLSALLSAFLAHLRSKLFPCSLLHQHDFESIAAMASALAV